MYVILCYDAEKNRDAKLLKVSKKYLRHVQKSVFDGFLTPSQLKHLKNDLYRYLVPEEDSAVIYVMNAENAVCRCVIGRQSTMEEEEDEN